jgi:transglutaminase-like putative cysteine protease
MRIRVSHQIVHRFDPPARTVNQILRLTPLSFDSQYVLRWRLDIDADGARRETEDAHGNAVTSYSRYGPIERVTISAVGEVETSDAAGIVRGAAERLPPEMYLRESPLAQLNGALRAFAAEATSGADSPLDSMHRLMAALHEALPLHPEEKDAAGSAIEAFALRRARAVDFAHIFIACARWRGIPARFVAGYRLADGSAEAGAHEWAEAHIPELGWVAFDATVPICPDDRYVRVAIGFDGQDGAMTRSAHSGGAEKVEADIRVEQAGVQTQA